MTYNLYSERKQKVHICSTHFYLRPIHLYVAFICVTFLLQANVMLEYPLEDATDLLVKNIDAAKKNLSYVEHDLDFLR